MCTLKKFQILLSNVTTSIPTYVYCIAFISNLNKKIILLGAAIRCYECNSYNDTRCANEKPPSEFSISCTKGKEGAESTTCRKIVQQIEFSVNGRKNLQIELFMLLT